MPSSCSKTIMRSRYFPKGFYRTPSILLLGSLEKTLENIFGGGHRTEFELYFYWLWIARVMQSDYSLIPLQLMNFYWSNSTQECIDNVPCGCGGCTTTGLHPLSLYFSLHPWFFQSSRPDSVSLLPRIFLAMTAKKKYCRMVNSWILALPLLTSSKLSFYKCRSVLKDIKDSLTCEYNSFKYSNVLKLEISGKMQVSHTLSWRVLRWKRKAGIIASETSSMNLPPSFRKGPLLPCGRSHSWAHCFAQVHTCHKSWASTPGWQCCILPSVAPVKNMVSSVYGLLQVCMHTEHYLTAKQDPR